MPYLDAVVSLMRVVIAWASGLLNGIVKGLLRPSSTSILIGSVVDLSRSKVDLIAENALLRHQLALLKRQSKRPHLKPADRLSLLLLATVTRTWRQALLIVQPATLLRTPQRGILGIARGIGCSGSGRADVVHVSRESCLRRLR
jgi:hypothetical protein